MSAYRIPGPRGTPTRNVREVDLRASGTLLGRLAAHGSGGEAWHNRMADILTCATIRWIGRGAIAKWYKHRGDQKDLYGKFFRGGWGLTYDLWTGKYTTANERAYPMPIGADESQPGIAAADADATRYGGYQRYVHESMVAREHRLEALALKEGDRWTVSALRHYMLRRSVERRMEAKSNLTEAVHLIDEYCRYTQIDSPEQHLEVVQWFEEYAPGVVPGFKELVGPNGVLLPL